MKVNIEILICFNILKFAFKIVLINLYLSHLLRVGNDDHHFKIFFSIFKYNCWYCTDNGLNSV